MLILLAQWLHGTGNPELSSFRVFQYLTFRAVMAAVTALLIGLIIGFQVGGLVGSLLAVPVIGTLKEVARYVVAKLVDRDPFPDEPRPRRRRPRPA